MTTAHTYIRCVNKIFVGDPHDNWRELHNFETEKRAKRWQNDQEKKRPGSVTVGHTPPQVTRAKIDQLKADYEQRRQTEIRKLVREQEADRRRQSYHVSGHGTPISNKRIDQKLGLSGKTAQLARSYVAPDQDESSSSRRASRMPVRSRKRKATPANSGGL